MNPLVVVGVVTIIHGLAHLVPAIGAVRGPLVSVGWSSADGSTGSIVAPRGMVIAAFGVCAMGFVIGGVAATETVLSISLWRPFTESAAIFSVLSIVVLPNAFPPSFRYQWIALAIDVVIIGNWLQLWDWPV